MTSNEKRQRHKDGHRSRMEAARLAQARARRRRRLVNLGLVVVFLALVVGAAVYLLGDDDDSSASATTTTLADLADPAEDTTTTAADGEAVEMPPPPEGRTITGETPCPAPDGSEERVAAFAQAPPKCIVDGEPLEAEVVTSEGTITIALDAEAAPETVNNFVVLARYRYYDGLPFHRLVPGFVAQTGSSGVPDYGSGGPGYDLGDGEKPEGHTYTAGDVAMARSDTVSGSQLFFVASDEGAASLTPEYPLLGRVTAGQDVVEQIAAQGDATPETNGRPLSLVTIESVTIRPAGA